MLTPSLPFVSVLLSPFARRCWPAVGVQRNRRICVVTGASGFLARHLVNRLVASGDYDEIRAVDIIAPVYDSPKVVSLPANICGTQRAPAARRGWARTTR